MQKFLKLLRNSLYGENICNDISEEFKCTSEYWMSAEYDERVLDYWRLPNREYIVQLKQDDGLECEPDMNNTKPAHLGSFIFSNFKRIMQNFIREIDSFKTNNA